VSAVPAEAGTLQVGYTVNCQDPARHIFRLTLALTGLGAGPHTLEMPAWAGAYEIENFARHVFDMRAFDQDGHPLAIDKTQKSTWVFESPSPDASVEYAVYADNLSTTTSHLDDTHAYWNGGTLFCYVDGHKELPVDVRIVAPAGWYASTALNADPDDSLHFWADNFDVLVDSPVEVGTHRRYTFDVNQKRHTIAIWGQGNQDDARLVADTRRIVEAEADLFGGLPYPNYTFIFHIAERGTGGTEHKNSTICGFSRFTFQPWQQYRQALSLIAHEFFHLWNVKRIHPDLLGPFDYTQEVPTHLLWAMEGFTSYYAYLLLARAHLYAPQDYLELVARDVERYEQLPGRHVMSLAGSSFDTWLGEYQHYADKPNRHISYYLKGSLVGLCLDLEIRRRTANRRSLDDVQRLLFARYGQYDRGFSEAVYQTTAEEVAGGSLAAFFGRYINGVEELPLDAYLATAGLQVLRESKWPDDSPDDCRHGETRPHAPTAWLGIDTADRQGRVVVLTVYDPGPAAGVLNAEDELLALNNFRIPDSAALATRIASDHQPGTQVELSLFRRGHLISRTVTLGTKPPNHYRIRRVAHPSPAQQATYTAWLGYPWSEDIHRDR